MLSIPCEARSCSPLAIVSHDRRVAPREAHAFTGVVTDLHIERSGRHLARLNAFVDGLGQRTLHVALDAHARRQVFHALLHPGTLIRGSGELVTEGPRLLLLHTQGLQFLVPEPNELTQ